MEGTVRRRLSADQGGESAAVHAQRSDQDLVAPLDHRARVRRPDLRGLQRAQVSARVRDREHGRAQARRVRADAHLPRPWRRQESAPALRNGSMGKPKHERDLTDQQAMAMARLLRTSPRKLNLLAQLIRGRKANDALNQLTFSRRGIAGDVKKVLMSAIANAENNHNLDVDRLVVSEAGVGKSLVMKRFRARARGRAGRIVKPFARLRIVVEEREEAA